MKIAYVTSFFPPDRLAGAELGTHFMARHMAARGHEVHVLITRPAKARRDIEKKDGYTLHWLDWRNIPGLRLFSEITAAGARLRSLCPDLIHGNCLLPGGFVATRMARELRCASVVLCYGYDVSDMQGWQARFFGKPALKHADLLLAASRYTAGQCRRWHPREARIFYAGCDTGRLQLQPRRQPVPPYKLLFIGRLIREKGLDLLADTFSRLPGNYQLEIIGRGALRGWLEKRAADEGWGTRVQWTEYWPNEKLGEKFAGSDGLILPSLREPFGVVCIEAIVSGVPVVCSDVMGLPEAVQNGRNGLVLNHRDPARWAEAVRRMVEEPDLRDTFYAAAREDREKWSWDVRLRELEGIYAKLTGP